MAQEVKCLFCKHCWIQIPNKHVKSQAWGHMHSYNHDTEEEETEGYLEFTSQLVSVSVSSTFSERHCCSKIVKESNRRRHPVNL